MIASRWFPFHAASSCSFPIFMGAFATRHRWRSSLRSRSWGYVARSCRPRPIRGSRGDLRGGLNPPHANRRCACDWPYSNADDARTSACFSIVGSNGPCLDHSGRWTQGSRGWGRSVEWTPWARGGWCKLGRDWSRWCCQSSESSIGCDREPQRRRRGRGGNHLLKLTCHSVYALSPSTYQKRRTIYTSRRMLAKVTLMLPSVSDRFVAGITAVTYTTPESKVIKIASFCRWGRCSRHTARHGRIMMITSSTTVNAEIHVSTLANGL